MSYRSSPIFAIFFALHCVTVCIQEPMLEVHAPIHMTR